MANFEQLGLRSFMNFSQAKGFLLSDVPDLSKKRLTIAVELEEPAVPHPTWSQTVHIITDALPSHAEPSNAVDTCSVAAINGGRETDGENSLEVVENLLKKDPAKESTSPKHLGMEEQDVSFVNSSRESTVSSNGVLPKVRSSEMWGQRKSLIKTLWKLLLYRDFFAQTPLVGFVGGLAICRTIEKYPSV